MYTHVLTILILAMNTIAVTAFMKRETRTPLSVVLSFLAFTYGITAICISAIDTLSSMSFHDLKEGLYERTWNPDFTECVVYSVLLCIKSAFQMTSILLTMSLSIQKSVAILFPIRSKDYLTTLSMSIWSLTLYFMQCFIFICA